MLTLTTYGRRAGSARVRVFDWLNHLDMQAETHTYLDGVDNRLTALLGRPLDVVRAEARLRTRAASVQNERVFISRQASPFSNGEIETQFLKTAQYGVYDFDDALMIPHKGAKERVWSKSRSWAASVTSADRVIAGNDYLAEEASRLNDSVVIVPSCVEPSAYTAKTSYEQTSTPTAVWLGSPSTEGYLSLIAGPLLEAHAINGMRLSVISSGQRSLGRLDSIVDRISWSESSFARDLAHADFGIMPLSDSAWTRGKCAYKLLQYGAAGLPMIASPVGTNAKVLERVDGLAPNSDREWRDALVGIMSETAAQREARGLRARATVQSQYSFESWARVWRSTVQ